MLAVLASIALLLESVRLDFQALASAPTPARAPSRKRAKVKR